MAEFTVEVTETVSVRKRYTVEADTREEALEKAGDGDTIEEEEIRVEGVTDRQVADDTLAEVPEEADVPLP